MRFSSGALGLVLLATTSCARVGRQVSAPAALAGSNALSDARQLVVVITPSWNATTGTLRRFERDVTQQAWRPAAEAIPVVIGRTGLAWGDETLASAVGQPVKHEGDGRSPAGAFPLDTAFGFAPRSDVSWMRLPYASLQPGSDCVDDEASAYYNTVVDRATVPTIDWHSAEHMRQIAQYRLGIIVGYNAAPPQKGRGSCIFLHIWSGPLSTTAGCTALDAGALEALLQWLDGARRPMLVQLPAEEYTRLRGAWGLPPS
jgi:D-alanyl-D-alanine dipeptidase